MSSNNRLPSVKVKSKYIRPLPYPFLGALAISSDVEYFSFDFFETLMQFLNTTATTALGTGLGLETTSSFFFFSAPTHTFSYFSGTDIQTKPTQFAPRIGHYLQRGWIDTNHAYGDFDGVGGFQRQHAEACYAELQNLGVSLTVFTNHGSADNIQNIGMDAAYHQGDQVASPAYHADLMKQNGVSYIWTDSMKFSRRKPDFVRRAKRLIRRMQGQALPHFPSNRLLHPCSLQDGSCFTGVLRFESTGKIGPNLSSLGAQLRQLDWQQVYHEHNIIVLYQHLGVLYPIGTNKFAPATLAACRQRPEVYLSPFYFLQREAGEGRLWVGGLHRLLHYVAMVEAVQVEVAEDALAYHLRYPVVVRQPEPFFQGLTLYTNQQPIKVYYQGQDICAVPNGPDETGQYSVTVPLQKLETIW